MDTAVIGALTGIVGLIAVVGLTVAMKDSAGN